MNELERFALLRNADHARLVGYVVLLPDLPDDWSKAEITPIRANGKLIAFALHQPMGGESDQSTTDG